MAKPHDPLGEALFALGALAVRNRERELSLTAVSTLSTLERTGPRRLTDLAGTERVTQPSMTTIVNQLEVLGFAERRSDPTDGRVVMVVLTRAGGQYLRALRRAGALTFTRLIDQLADADVMALRDALPALRHLVELSTDGGTGDDRPVEGAFGTRPAPRSPRRLKDLSVSTSASEGSPQ